jgi:hypothetical protein
MHHDQINQESINDTAKLIIHRLIARAVGRDPSLVKKAKVSLGSQGYSFVPEWNDLLDRPTPEIRQLLTSRDENMTRLRLSSPFVVTEGLDFTDTTLRRRIWKAAKRVAERRNKKPRR